MGVTAKHGFPWPAGPDLISQGDDAIKSLAEAIDVAVATDSQGLLSARPAAGKAGRYYRATDFDVLFRDDGIIWRPVGAAVLDRTTAVQDVVNTVVETSVYAFSIPANTLSSNRGVRLTLVGDYLNDSGAGRTLAVRVNLAVTTLFVDTTATIASDVNRREVSLALELFNQGATNDQLLSGRFTLGPPHAAAIGRGDLGVSPTVGTVAGDGTADTTAANTLNVTVVHSAAAANVSFRRQRALLELL